MLLFLHRVLYSKYEKGMHFKNVNLYLMLNKLMNKLIFIRNLKTVNLRIWLSIFKWLKNTHKKPYIYNFSTFINLINSVNLSFA